MLEPFLQTLDRFARERVDALGIDAAGSIPAAILTDLAELGVFGLPIPTEYGGAGVSLAGVCAVVERLARHDRSIAVSCGLHMGLGTRGLVAFGAPSLKDRFLPELASGKRIGAFATTEPSAGSDLGGIRTRARPAGARLRVDGEKIYVTNGGFAGLVTLTVSTPDLGGARRGHSLIVLEPDAPGVEVGPEEDKLGLRGSSTVSLRFDGVEVEPTQVVGEPGAGMRQLTHVLTWGRTIMAAGCVGAARAALARAEDHVRTRHQFGKPLAAQPVVKAQLTEMASSLLAAEAIVTRAAETDEADRLRLSLAAKVFASEASGRITDRAVQLFGGLGFIEETGIPLLLRDVRITRIFEGANDVLLTHLGAIETADPFAAPREAWSVETRLAELSAEIRSQHGLQILRRPLELHRLGRIALLAEVTSAVRSAERSEGAARIAARCWQQSAEAQTDHLSRTAPEVGPELVALLRRATA